MQSDMNFARRARHVLWLVALTVCLIAQGEAVPAQSALEMQLVTNIATISEFSGIAAIQGWPLRMEGVVTMVDQSQGRLVLQNSDGAVALRMGFGTEVRPGKRIRVESDNAASIVPFFPEFPAGPTGSNWLATLSAPANQGSSYLARIHGFLVPPVTGDYSFWVASKGSSELWLSTNADPAGLRSIAQVPTGKATNPRQWDKFPAQASGLIHLEAGRHYLLDLFHEHQAGRDDTVAVAWQGPGISQCVVDGRYIIPYSRRDTNGVVREYWNDYFQTSVEKLTAAGLGNVGLNVEAPRIQVLGDGQFPEPMPMEIGAAMPSAQNYRWVRVEGMVEFAAVDGDRIILELVADQARTELILSAGAIANLGEMVGARVRASGVCEEVIDASGNRTAGIIRVPTAREFTEVAPSMGDIKELKAVSIGDLSPTNPVVAPGRKIRVHGTLIRQADGTLAIQGAARFSGAISTNGVDWESVPSTGDVAMRDLALGGLLACSFRSGNMTIARFDSVKGIDPLAQDMEISRAAPEGKTTMTGDGAFVMHGGGTGFSANFERVHFFSEPQANAMEITARVTGLESSEVQSEAGIMVRDSVDPWTSFASLTLNGNRAAIFRSRQNRGDRSEVVSLPGHSVPCWLRLTRNYPRLEVKADGSLAANVGESIDLVGVLQWRADRPILAGARRLDPLAWKSLRASAGTTGVSADSGAEPPLARIAELRPDRGDELKEGIGSVRVRGVVTFNGEASGTNYLMVQDESAGALVRLGGRFTRLNLSVGEFVEFELASKNGRWPFPFDPSQVQILGKAPMPKPAGVSMVDGRDRRNEYDWVECQGIVREARRGAGLKLVCPLGQIPVWVDDATNASMDQYVDALVRIRGVLVGKDNKFSLLAPALSCVEVVEPPPAKPFNIPTLAIKNLGAFALQAPNSHRVKVVGTMTYKNDQLMVIQDDSGGVRLETTVPADVAVGDQVEAAGFVDGEPGFVVLLGSLVQKNGSGRLPQPRNISAAELVSGAHDGQLVRLSGELLEQKMEDGNRVLELQSGQQVFRAYLVKSPASMRSIPVGSEVQATGVSYAGRVGGSVSGYGLPEPASFQVLLRAPGDVVIVQWPPWWAWKHATMVIGTLALILAAAMLWIRMLRTKVAQRTHELEVAMSKLERETETSATLAERNRLAGEIHDGVEQGLSAIMMQLDGLESKLGADPTGATRYLELARSMVRFSRTEVRHSLWDWHSPALADKNLAAALTEIATQMSAGNETQVAVHVTGDAVPLPATAEHHLLRIAQEALNNSLKYAHASAIEVHLEYGGTKVGLSVRDNGCGFDPDSVLNAAGGHFGLQNLRSRARKMRGSLQIISAPGRGTVIEATVPADSGVPKPRGEDASMADQ